MLTAALLQVSCADILGLDEFVPAKGSSASSGTAGGGGSWPVCEPGSVEDCYSGPPGTEGVGICTVGKKTCNMEGTDYGPCEGELTPQPEDCKSPADEDCNGYGCGDTAWAKLFGDVSNQTGVSIAADSTGNVLVAGAFDGTIDFGGGPLITAGNTDVFLAKLDPSGKHIWSQRFGNASADSITGLAVDGANNVIMSGIFRGTVQFGTAMLASLGMSDTDSFVVKVDPSGNVVWASKLGGMNNQSAYGVAVDSAGDALVTGLFIGDADFGAGTLPNAGATDVFLVKMAGQDGSTLWSRGFGGLGAEEGRDVVTDASGNIIVLGAYSGDGFSLGAGPFVPAVTGIGNIFIAKYDSAGNHSWHAAYSDNVGPGRIAVDKMGSVIATGGFVGTVDLGGSLLTSAGSNDMFVVKLSAGGSHIWSQQFGGPMEDEGIALAVDVDANVVLAGHSNTYIDLGGGSLTPAGAEDVVLAKFDNQGGHVWSRRFGGALSQYVGAVSVDSQSGSVLLIGYTAESIDFGEGLLMYSGGTDTYVAKLAR